MGNIRNRFERFCYRNRNKGIPNLMLYLSIGSALVYLMSSFAGNYVLYSWLCFDRSLILQGQIWRLFTYPLTYNAGNILLTAITLFCYYSIGRAIESVWGTLKFNLFYLTGVIMMDIFCMFFPLMAADVTYLNMSLFLAYATMNPNAQFLLFFIIPIKAWVFALIDFALTLWSVLSLSFPTMFFPYNLYPLIAIANYFLFFGKDVANIIPLSWRIKMHRKPKKPKVVPFTGTSNATNRTQQQGYTHRCTACGRTDVSHPNLEFRYCSRCKGYFCYCQDHINNHNHIE